MCGLASGAREQRWHRLHTAGMLRRMSERPADVIDNPIERLELLAGDDEAIASFLGQIEVTGPWEREMLGELARTGTLADPERFPAAHRRASPPSRRSAATATTERAPAGPWAARA
jgi:hypothetical protein